MFKNLFKKQKKESQNNKNILIIALLVHAAKIDENYTEIEKDIIKKVIMQLNQINLDESEDITPALGKTKTAGSDFTILQQIFSNLRTGRFAKID